jgi:hypothetical protein
VHAQSRLRSVKGPLLNNSDLRAAECSHRRPMKQGELPRDLATLHRKAGLRSFLAAAIGPKGSPRGVLVVGRMEARGFDDSECVVGGAAGCAFTRMEARCRCAKRACVHVCARMDELACVRMGVRPWCMRECVLVY